MKSDVAGQSVKRADLAPAVLLYAATRGRMLRGGNG
jgi:hypothetical protein